MKQLSFLLLSFFTACSSNKVSESDLVGKTFEAAIQIDSAIKDNPVAVGIVALDKMVYSFKNNNVGIIHAETGIMTSDQPFTWHIMGDSLWIDRAIGSASEITHQAIQKTDSGFNLVDGNGHMQLTTRKTKFR